MDGKLKSNLEWPYQCVGYLVNGQFAPAKWNVYSEEGPRMNNNLEGWHSKVKKITGKNHN